MKIALVSTYTRPVALGLRYVSSCLKAAGHDVEILFMSSRHDTPRPDYGTDLLEDFTHRLRGRDLIGMSLMTNSFRRALTLTEQIRMAGIEAPVLWGGVHPTLSPEECLVHADAVCVGEGERPMLQLAERIAAGQDPTTVAGLWFRAGGAFGNRGAVRNPPARLVANLDELPFPDYELQTHWVAARQRLVPAGAENLRRTLHKFVVITSRGCPYHCTFCNNSALRKAHEGAGRWVRLRSLEQVLAEMHQAVSCFPTVEAFHIVDDLFFVHGAEDIERFAAMYREDVGLPLLVQISPTTATERKVRAIAQAPLNVVIMGIQSASENTLNRIYARPTPPERIASAIEMLAKHGIPTEYHYIVSNPYEPEENVIETMRFVASHHRRAKTLQVFPLMFFPGTPLFDRARADGIIRTRDDLAYEHDAAHAGRGLKPDYYAICLRVVLKLRNVGVPGPVVHRLIDFLTHRTVRGCLSRKWVAMTVFLGYKIAGKVFRNLLYQPFVKPFQLLRRRPRTAKRRAVSNWIVPRNGAGAASAMGVTNAG